MKKQKKVYKPGDSIPISGVYRVEHNAHRLVHEATLLADSAFPRCRQCVDRVRFRLVRAVEGRHMLPFRSSTILEEFEPPAPPVKIAS